jgi:UDP-N-acetylenolpyruvoylglucosamine reductase
MQIRGNISLKPYNTFGIDVKARYFAKLHSDNEMAAFFSSLEPEHLPVLILGGGSNVLFTKDFEGSVACIRSKGIAKLMEDEKHVYLKIAAGEVKKQRKDRFVITGLCLKLAKQPVLKLSYGAIGKELEKAGVKEPTISAVRDIIIKIRSSKLPDPAILGNAGSFFMNPVISSDDHARLIEQYHNMPSFRSGDAIKVPGAWLIERCGWKGRRFGDAGVYSDQPLVLVNYGNATGREILSLAENIIDSVKEKFGITLEKEVNVI